MNRNILFVDDDKSLLQFFRRLINDTDLNVLTAENAQCGLAEFKNSSIAVVFSDYIMPGMNGIDFISEVKRTYPDTVRVLMTSHSDVQIAFRAMSDGDIFKFILKPWDNHAMIQIVREAVHRYEVAVSLKRADEPTLLSLSQTIELKDRNTQGHCDRVAAYSLIIAEALELGEETITNIRYGSWLHDCGKIGVEETILNSEMRLNDNEWRIIKNHPVWGADMATVADLHPIIVNIVHYHHERYDGGGYPAGLKGDEIPLEARIVAVADAFDAITSNRSYREKRSIGSAFDILKLEKNKHFDPLLVDILSSKLDLVREIIETAEER